MCNCTDPGTCHDPASHGPLYLCRECDEVAVSTRNGICQECSDTLGVCECGEPLDDDLRCGVCAAEEAADIAYDRMRDGY